MTRIARQLADGLREAYKQAHPEEPEEVPSAEDTEAAGIAALRAAIYGTPTPPTAPVEENHDQ
jgi:hypothetical protein